MKKVVQKIICAGVVVNDGKALIIQRAADDDSYPGLWEIPSGKREILEKTVDGVKREVLEETGLTVEVGNPVGVFDFKVEKEAEIRDATQISFLCKPVDSTQVNLSSEHQNFAWIDRNEIDKYNISDETKALLKKSL